MDRLNKFSLNNISNDANFDFKYSLLNNNEDDDFDFSGSPYDVTNISCSYVDESDFVKLKHSNNLKIMSLNIQSLTAKFSELKNLIASLQINNCEPDILCLQELWQFNTDVDFSIAGYHPLLYKIRSNNVQGGGVGIYVKNVYNFTHLSAVSVFHDRLFESIFCEISIGPKKIVIGSIYRPTKSVYNFSPAVQFEQFCEILTNVTSEIQKSNKEMYLLGDLNIDVLKYKSCNLANTYVDLLFSNGLLQVVTKPTRCTNSSATLLDHVITNSQSNNFASYVLISFISDHFPVIFELSNNVQPSKPKILESRNFSAQNVDNFNTFLSNQNWDTLLAINDPQRAYNEFSDTFFNIYNMFFPLKCQKFNRNVHCLEKWMSKGLLISRNHKMHLGKLYANNPTVANCTIFKNYRNLYNRVIRAAKKQYFDHQFVKNQSNLKKTWELIFDSIKKTKKCKSQNFMSIIIDNISYSDPYVIATKFNEFFTNIAATISSTIHPAELPPNFFDPDPNCPFFDFDATPVSQSEISEAISQLQVKKTLDCNGLSTLILSKNSLCLSKPLQHVFSLSLSNGIVPSQLKIAKVIPIFKAGDNQSVDNYRPISLLNVFSKVLEKIVYNRVVTFLDINNILSPSQFGFRKKHSTVHPLSLFVNSIANSLNKKIHSVAIFCDLKKAFDTVDHKILLKKLSKIGIRGSALKWFEDYLYNRYQYVCIESANSKLLPISVGVPQGSILGPLLFLLYINDLPKISKLICYLFADDTTLLASHQDPVQLLNFVNTEFRKIVHYFRAHKLSLHPTKTKFIVFSNSSLVNNFQFNICINNNNDGELFPDFIQPLEQVTSKSDTPAIKFLGVFIDPELNFKFHIKTIVNKLSKALYFLKSAKNILSSNALRSLYYAIFHCHLVYCVHIWSCTSANNLAEIVKKQKAAIRILTLSTYNSHTEPLFKKMNILPFNEMVTFFKLQFMFFFKNNLLPQAFERTWLTNAERLDDLNLSMLLRRDEEYHIPFARISQIDKFPIVAFPRIWNDFNEDDIKNAPTKSVFNSKLKKFLIDKLDANYICNRLLCPHCHINL
jgi:Reverse transcriptase (RNA-dependent DNA polymerase)/Endonuclease/Exonuclease/phosphatase family